MVNAQEWLDKIYPTAEAKAAVKRIGPKEDIQKRIGYDLISVFTKSRDPMSTILLGFESMMNKDNHIRDDLNLEGPLSLKGFFNLEELSIENQKITALDISDCLKLQDLSCGGNQLKNLDVSNNRQLVMIGIADNQLTDIDLTGLTEIEKIFCSGNKLESLEFLESIDPTKVLTLRMDNNKFPAKDLSFFARFINLQRLYISDTSFYGSLKPLRNLNNLKGIGIVNTDIDSGLEYLPEDFFKVNVAASSIGFRGGYFERTLSCSGKLAEQLKDYKLENDPLRNYDWDTWRQHNQDLINKVKEQEQIENISQIMKKQALVEDLKNNEGLIKQLSTENQQLQAEITRLEKMGLDLQYIKDRLNKNELIMKEKKQIIEELKEKIKRLEELMNRHP